MHYHVSLRDGPGQIAMLTGHHTYRTETAALDAARRLIKNGVHTRVVRDDIWRMIRTGGNHVYVTACENPLCLADGRCPSRSHGFV